MYEVWSGLFGASKVAHTRWLGVRPPALNRLEPEHCCSSVVRRVDHILWLIGIKFYQLSKIKFMFWKIWRQKEICWSTLNSLRLESIWAITGCCVVACQFLLLGSWPFLCRDFYCPRIDWFLFSHEKLPRIYVLIFFWYLQNKWDKICRVAYLVFFLHATHSLTFQIKSEPGCAAICIWSSEM